MTTDRTIKLILAFAASAMVAVAAGSVMAHRLLQAESERQALVKLAVLEKMLSAVPEQIGDQEKAALLAAAGEQVPFFAEVYVAGRSLPSTTVGDHCRCLARRRR